MKPINIKISAFGPYKNEIDIDFTKLGENGLFLITGDTGAGKTSIFDAISFALFGEVSGSNRPVLSLRSDFAEIDTETFVELEFTHKKKIYKIRRNPAYERAKKKGEGTTKTGADASLEFEDKIITGTKNVDAKIEEILGINAKQFKQIAMLAQGEFLKILFAESRERTEIFRRIFDTDIYNLISRKLKERASQANRELEQLKDFFAINASNIIWKEQTKDVMPKEVNELLVKEILENLTKQLELDKEEYKILEKSVKEQEDKISILEKEVREQEDKNNQIDLYNKLKIRKEELKQKEKSIIQINLQLQKNQEIISKILPKEEKAKEAESEIEKIKQNLKIIEKKIIVEEEKEKNSNKIQEILDVLKVQYQKYKELKDLDAKIQENIKKIKTINAEIQNKEKSELEYKKLELEWTGVNSTLLEKETQFFREQAGILAEHLKENEPCPVCGSTHHPKLAEKTENVLTKEQLEQLRKKEKDSKDVLIIATNKLSEIKSKIETLLSALGENIVFERYKEEVKIQYQENTNNLRQIHVQLNENYKIITKKEIDIANFDYDVFKNEITNKIIEDREQLLRDKTQEEENKKLLKEKLDKQDIVNQEYKNALEELGFESKEQYKESILNKSQIERLTKEIDDFKTETTANNTRIEEIEKVVKDFNKINLTDKKQELTSKKQELQNSRDVLMKQNGVLNNNSRILNTLNAKSKELNEKIKEYNIIEDLSRTANGNIIGKQRIEFEQFVQASYFDMIIVEANKRLLKMTDNRFWLIRKESSEKVSDKIGLELEVIDNYNGKKRDVKSLSGGEAFKAALSLALGLSDIIQSYSGGVLIETMFIDEGFGSLDTESRENAINTLNQLTDNKLIGIISHVTELKERIDKKIIVHKTPDGSKIELEN